MKGGVELELPAGFRFHPTDEELVMYYLCPKCAGQSILVPIIAEIDLYKFDPWQLPSMAAYGEKEWYFFTPRDRKYPNGSRPNRAAGRGYWKATGADKPVGKPKARGIKKSLVFYTGKAPTGFKTNWIMHEYRLANVDRSIAKKNMRLDDWVLCRIYNKKGIVEKAIKVENQEPKDNIFVENGMLSEAMPQKSIKVENQEPKDSMFVQNGMVSQAMPQKSSMPLQMMNDILHFDTSESVLSAEFSCDKEVQSLQKLNEFDRILDYQLNYTDGFQDDPFASQMQQFNDYRFFPLQDMFM